MFPVFEKHGSNWKVSPVLVAQYNCVLSKVSNLRSVVSTGRKKAISRENKIEKATTGSHNFTYSESVWSQDFKHIIISWQDVLWGDFMGKFTKFLNRKWANLRPREIRELDFFLLYSWLPTIFGIWIAYFRRVLRILVSTAFNNNTIGFLACS